MGAPYSGTSISRGPPLPITPTEGIHPPALKCARLTFQGPRTADTLAEPSIVLHGGQECRSGSSGHSCLPTRCTAAKCAQGTGSGSIPP
ncbi:unnamed protein product [Lasius platythorax]|uniref:Uncharacterized protein n=1 Tax=Lasius platythorax TaxID=488582 RepID=A0AAV2MZZ5_9HYME